MKNYEVIRRIRRTLLSNLSVLVKTALNSQAITDDEPTEEVVQDILDEMLLKAYKTVACGVRFLDSWNEDLGWMVPTGELEIAINFLSNQEKPPSTRDTGFDPFEIETTPERDATAPQRNLAGRCHPLLEIQGLIYLRLRVRQSGTLQHR